VSALDPALQWALRIALAWLLMAAGLSKLRRAAAFREALADYRLLPTRLAAPAACGLAGLELGTGLALLAPPLAGGAAALAAGLFALYGAAMALNLARGRRHIDCGCGPAPRPLGAGLVARNALLVLTAGLAALPGGARTLVWVDVLTVIAGALVAGLLYSALDGVLAHAPRLAALRSRP
jgi:uncharacterized membrane protein YphA (DoxX/SURF4 family)